MILRSQTFNSDCSRSAQTSPCPFKVDNEAGGGLQMLQNDHPKATAKLKEWDSKHPEGEGVIYLQDKFFFYFSAGENLSEMISKFNNLKSLTTFINLSVLSLPVYIV